jgi:hypothetical protein
VSERIIRGRIEHPRIAALVFPGPVIAKVIPLIARPAGVERDGKNLADVAAENAALHLRNGRVVDVLEANRDGNFRAIARRNHRIDIIHASGGRLLAHDCFSRGHRHLRETPVQVDRHRQPDGFDLGCE